MTMLSFSFVCIPSKQLFLDVSFQVPLFQSVFSGLALLLAGKLQFGCPPAGFVLLIYILASTILKKIKICFDAFALR